MFVVFTKALRQYMKDGIEQLGLSPSNFVHFAACFEWNNGIRGDWKMGNYDYIILDEAQDFSFDDIKILQTRTNKAILIYGDSAQQLYKFIKEKSPVSMEDIQYLTKYPVEQLVFNHRLPKKIARFAQYLNSENDELDERCTLEGAEKPKILQYLSIHAQLDAIMQIIRNKSLEDVGILFRTNREVEDAYSYFREHNMNTEAKIDGYINLDFNSGNPKLMTYHSSKGLQFEYVFLPECTAEGEENKVPLYVAITRSYRALYIMHSGKISNLLAPIPCELYDTSLSSGTNINL